MAKETATRARRGKSHPFETVSIEPAARHCGLLAVDAIPVLSDGTQGHQQSRYNIQSLIDCMPQAQCMWCNVDIACACMIDCVLLPNQATQLRSRRICAN